MVAQIGGHSFHPCQINTDEWRWAADMFKICKLQYEDATRFDKIQYKFTNIVVWEIFREITHFLSRSAFVQVLKEHLQKLTIVTPESSVFFIFDFMKMSSRNGFLY